MKNLNKEASAVEQTISEQIASSINCARVKYFTDLSLGRVLRNKHKRGKIGLHDIEIAFSKLEMIVDWLEAEVETGAAWTHRTDEAGRPRKLMKFSTVEQIVSEAEKALSKRKQKRPAIIISEGDEEFVTGLDYGFYLVRLLTPNALRVEGKRMQNCLRNGGHDVLLDDDGFEFLSLRDASGNPHMTIELDNSFTLVTLNELQGKQNKPPLERYHSIVIPYFKSRNIRPPAASERIPFVIDDHGEWHDLFNLPDRLEISELFIEFETAVENFRLPSDLPFTRSIGLWRVNALNWPNHCNHCEVSLYDCNIGNFTGKMPSGNSVSFKGRFWEK